MVYKMAEILSSVVDTKLIFPNLI